MASKASSIVKAGEQLKAALAQLDLAKLALVDRVKGVKSAEKALSKAIASSQKSVRASSSAVKSAGSVVKSAKSVKSAKRVSTKKAVKVEPVSSDK